LKIYEDGGPIIFQQNKMGWYLDWGIYILWVSFCGLVFFRIGSRMYDNKKKQKAHDELHNFLMETYRKKIQKTVTLKVQ